MPALPPPEEFESAVLADWARRGWDPSGSCLLLCVSGGADSIALLRLFLRQGPGLGCRLAAVHIDHRLRAESGEDAAFVARACAEAGVPLAHYALDPGTRPPRESAEMWGRRERYARFEEAAARHGADWILTAHQRDDLVETFFQRLGRGTGPRGLAAIPFRRGRIVRPFLDRPRPAVAAYLAALGAPWREDPSNADPAYERNWYRHRYLPALRAREPDLDARVAALAAAMREMAPGIEAWESEAALVRAGGPEGPCLDSADLEPFIRSGDGESLRYWLQRLIDASKPVRSAPMVTPAILREFLRQWEKGPDTLRVGIAQGLALTRGKRGICCARAETGPENAGRRPKKSCSPPAQRVILVGGSAHAEWQWGGRRFSLTARRSLKPAGLEFPSSGEDRAIFDADRISCTLLVRIRKDGDRFSPLGTHSRSRKLKTFLNEKKVPAALRDSLPLVVSCPHPEEAGTTAESGSMDPGSPEPGGEILAWVPGFGISDCFKVGGGTTHILELVMTCENP